MAEEKRISMRVVNKHEPETNWLKAKNFKPLRGEIIIYEVDATHSTPRLKIGDGVTTVNDLPFFGIASSTTWGSFTGDTIDTTDPTWGSF